MLRLYCNWVLAQVRFSICRRLEDVPERMRLGHQNIVTETTSQPNDMAELYTYMMFKVEVMAWLSQQRRVHRKTNDRYHSALFLRIKKYHIGISKRKIAICVVS